LTVPRSSKNDAAPEYWDDACKHLAKRDRVMRKLIPRFGEGRLHSRGDAFTTLARSIVGQQISVKAAQSVWERFVALTPPSPQLVPAFVLALDTPTMRSAGLSARKVEYLSDLAQHFDAGAVHVRQWQQMDDHHRRAGRDSWHRPLDRRDVPDLPSDAPERDAARRPGPHQGHQPELLQRRAGVACRSARGR
jgi:3-methyladenine DNA glycosylase/8-oxoguanine DNA glycosylase